MPYHVGQHETRPWGSWRVLRASSDMVVKVLEIDPGQCLSLQRHRHRAEWWTCIAGEVSACVSGSQHKLGPFDTAEIPRGALHQLLNLSDVPATVLEIQTGAILDEEDIERFYDEYGRVA